MSSRLKSLVARAMRRLPVAIADQATDLFTRTRLIPGLSPRQTRRLLGRSASLVVLDVGANDGTHSRLFARAFAGRVMVHAFEPEPRAIERFRSRLPARMASSVMLHEFALSDRDGSVTFFRSSGHPEGREGVYPEGWDGSGSIRPPKNHLVEYPWCSFDDTLEVPTRTLDSWATTQGVGTIDLIWMDVQGAEADVFRGGEDTLRRTRFLYTEYSNDELYEGQLPLDQLLELLPGWTVHKQFPGDVLLKNMAFETA